MRFNETIPLLARHRHKYAWYLSAEEAFTQQSAMMHFDTITEDVIEYGRFLIIIGEGCWC